MSNFHINGVRKSLSRFVRSVAEAASTIVDAVVTAIREIRTHVVDVVAETEDTVVLDRGLAAVAAVVAGAMLFAPEHLRRDEVAGELLLWAYGMWMKSKPKPDDDGPFTGVIV